MKSPFFVNSFISLVFFTLLCASNQYSFYWIYAKSLFYKFIDMRYSVIIPVYNRPDEVDELLQSLTVQCFKDFEVVIVEDGSSIPCKEVADRYTDRLDIKYFSKPNSGPGQTRNYGAERSEGEYFIILDSDVILPEGYFDAIGASGFSCRRVRWSRPCARFFYGYSESYQLLDDFLFYNRRYPWRKKEDGQVLSS